MPGPRRATKGPSRESIERALIHHSIRGAVREWKRPEAGSARWLITVPGQATLDLSTGQAWAFCVGLAAGERAYKP